MNSANISSVLARLAEEQAAEEENIRQCAYRHGGCIEELEEEIDSSSPIYDAYLQQGGSEAIQTLCNFSDAEFHGVWHVVQGDLEALWYTGRGKNARLLQKMHF